MEGGGWRVEGGERERREGKEERGEGREWSQKVVEKRKDTIMLYQTRVDGMSKR